jgi:hypothetical protein
LGAVAPKVIKRKGSEMNLSEVIMLGIFVYGIVTTIKAAIRAWK